MIGKTLQEAIPTRGAHLLAAVSGGADSVVLLHALDSLGYQVTAAHFNHQLRESSAADEDFVKSLCNTHRVPLCVGRGKVREAAADEQLSLEDAARKLRYEFLFSSAVKLDADAVVTGHHADDQVETILMNLNRGAGPAGLTGMKLSWVPNPWSNTIPLMRPLLSVWKEEILAYIQKHGLEFVEDPTNKDPSFLRNRIRHQLIPLLEACNQGFASHLLQTGLILREEDRLLGEMTDRAAQRCLEFKESQGVIIDREAFGWEPLAVQRRLIRHLYAQLRAADPELSFDRVEEALRFISDKRAAGEENWVGRLNLISLPDQVVISGWDQPVFPGPHPQIQNPLLLHDSLGNEVSLGEGWIIRLTKQPAGDLNLETPPDPYQQFLAFEMLSRGLELRSRSPGDRFQPLGMGGSSVKVSELMINEKIPARLRDCWPLLVAGGDIIWIPGIRMGEIGKVKPGATDVLLVELFYREQ